VPEHLICPRCGASNPLGSTSCANCGWAPPPPGQESQHPQQQAQQQAPPHQAPRYEQQPPYDQPPSDYQTPYASGQPGYGPPGYGPPGYGPPGYGPPGYGPPGATAPDGRNRRLLYILGSAALGLILVIVLAVILVPPAVRRMNADPGVPVTSVVPAQSARPSAPPSELPSPPPTAGSTAGQPPPAPPDYRKLGPQVSSGILKIVASGCPDAGSHIGSAFLINSRTAVASLSSLAGATVIALTDGERTVPASVSAVDIRHGIVVLRLHSPTSGHVFTLDRASLMADDPVGSYGVTIKGSRPTLSQTKITETAAETRIAGHTVTGLAATPTSVDAGLSGAPTLSADGHANGMVLLDPSNRMMIIPGRTIAAAVTRHGGSLPATGCSRPVGPNATVITGSAGKRVRAMLQRYFSGINSGDYASAFSQLSQRLQAGGFNGYREGWATSYDYNIVVHDATATRAHVTFDSIFEKGKGPKGSGTCARWDIDYRFVIEGGSPAIDQAKPHSGAIWRKC
jgi:hypothetical protein